MDDQPLRSHPALVPNRMKRKMLSGQMAFPYLTYLIARHEMIGFTASAGFDGLCIDLEHGLIRLDEAGLLACAAMAQGCVDRCMPRRCVVGSAVALTDRITPLIRIPAITFEWIGRAMEFGAQGIIAPQIQTAHEAKEVVKHAKYPPYGTRSIGAALPGLSYEVLGFEETARLLNDEILVVCIIETAMAVENIVWVTPGTSELSAVRSRQCRDWMC